MKTRLLSIGLLLSLAACGQSAPPPESATAAPAISSTPAASPAAATVASKPATSYPMQLAQFNGYGDLRFGMDRAAFDHAWGGKLNDSTPAAGSSCFYRRPVSVKQLADFSFMFEGGHFVRYDIGTIKETAPGGGKVGMSEAQIRALYGSNLDEQPHKYVDGAKYLRVKAHEGDSVLVFDTGADEKVTRWHVGVPPQVDYVEGCAWAVSRKAVATAR
jgi:hypothetical protein